MSKTIPQSAQLIVHSASGLYITPYLRLDADVEVRLWRLGPVSASDKSVQWLFIPVQGQDGVVRIKNFAYDRCLTLSKDTHHTPVTYTKTNDKDKTQLWKLISPDSEQADFVIASMLNTQLVISPKEGYQYAETTLEVEELGPWTDQFWRWREPRTT